ncbi:MAG TPA: PQQ-binding-like beta-propeller repeat protein [Acidobacteriota bacterium]
MKNKKMLFAVIGCFFLVLPAENVKKPAWKIFLAGESAGAPAVFAGKAIVAAKNGRLYSLDGAGKLLWKQKLPSGCLAAPTIDRNGDIYAACANGSLLRFSASGKPTWRVELKQELLATPLLAAETLFTVSGAGRVCKIRKKDGAVLKQVELHLPVHSSPVWDAERIKLLVPAKDYVLVALDQELQVVWKFRTAGVILSAPAVTPRDEIYLTSMDHYLYKLNAAGRLLWKYKARGWIKASPVIDEKGRVYFGSYDRYFYAVSSDGRPLWQFQGKAQFTASAAIDEADNLYCGDTSGTVYALDRDGRLSWRYKSPDFITADLTIMPEKILLAGSIDGTLLAFRVGQPMSKKAWWAKYLGNLANSGFDEQ